MDEERPQPPIKAKKLGELLEIKEEPEEKLEVVPRNTYSITKKQRVYLCNYNIYMG